MRKKLWAGLNDIRETILNLPTPAVLIVLFVLAGVIAFIPVGTLEDRLLLVGTVIGVAVAATLSWWTTRHDERKKDKNLRLSLFLEIEHNLGVVREINATGDTGVLAKRAEKVPDFSFEAWRSLQGDLAGAMKGDSFERVIRLYALLNRVSGLIGHSRLVDDEERRSAAQRQIIFAATPPGDRLHMMRPVPPDPRHASIRAQWGEVSRQILDIGNPLADVMG